MDSQVDALIATLYQLFLGRIAADEEIGIYHEAFVNGVSIDRIALSIALSTEANVKKAHEAAELVNRTREQQASEFQSKANPLLSAEQRSRVIRDVYDLAFDRKAAQHEVDEWDGHLESNLPLVDFIHVITGSSEFKSRRGFINVDTQVNLIDEAFRLMLNRAATPLDLLNTGRDFRTDTLSFGRFLLNLFNEHLADIHRKTRSAPERNKQVYMLGTNNLIDTSNWKYGRDARPAVGAAPVEDFVGYIDKPEVSIIVSMYKGRRYIQAFLDNIISQSVFAKYCEVIIIDACSPENEIDLIEPYMKRYKNIKYLRTEEVVGIYDAWNIGIRHSSGKYITNANLDDARRADSFQLQRECLDRLDFVDVVYQNFYYSFEENVSFSTIEEQGILCDLPVVTSTNLMYFNSPHNAPMWRRSLHDEVGWFDKRYRSAGDCDFWLRCAVAGKTFFKLNAPHVGYYWNPEGLSTNSETRGIEEHRQILNEMMPKLVAEEILQPAERFIEDIGGTVDAATRKDAYYDLVQRELVKLGEPTGGAISGAVDRRESFKDEFHVFVDSASMSPDLLEEGGFGRRIIEQIDAHPKCRLTLLDRGNLPPLAFPTLSFPSYSSQRFNAADSILLQKICDQYEPDLFVSLVTTPLRTPAILLVPNASERAFSRPRSAQELDLAFAFATAILLESDEGLMDMAARRPWLVDRQIDRIEGAILDTGQGLALRRSLVRPDGFYGRWEKLRRLQERVDPVLWDI